MDTFKLSKDFFDWGFENTDIVKPIHSAIYFFAIDKCNRLGWKEKFGFPSSHCMEAIGVRSYNTYKGALDDLVEWGFIEMIKKSRNQHTSNIIAISKYDKATNKALTKATAKHDTEQSESYIQSDGSIDILRTKEPINLITLEQEAPTTEKQKNKNHLFSNSSIATLEEFEKAFEGTDYENCNLQFYFESVRDWSLSKGAKKLDWVAVARNFMRGDKKDNKLQMKNGIELKGNQNGRFNNNKGNGNGSFDHEAFRKTNDLILSQMFGDG
jgi:hypothetical protein